MSNELTSTGTGHIYSPISELVPHSKNICDLCFPCMLIVTLAHCSRKWLVKWTRDDFTMLLIKVGTGVVLRAVFAVLKKT